MNALRLNNASLSGARKSSLTALAVCSSKWDRPSSVCPTCTRTIELHWLDTISMRSLKSALELTTLSFHRSFSSLWSPPCTDFAKMMSQLSASMSLFHQSSILCTSQTGNRLSMQMQKVCQQQNLRLKSPEIQPLWLFIGSANSTHLAFTPRCV